MDEESEDWLEIVRDLPAEGDPCAAEGLDAAKC
jgi:hypothetical protein